MSEPDPGLLERARELATRCTSTVADVLDDSAAVALLDIPNHDNPGDAAILLGEYELLRSLGVDVAYLADLRSFRREHLARMAPEGLVLLHGGGNTGDLYPRHQDFRESYLTEHPDRPVVQLPQSVYFQDADAAARARTVYTGVSTLTFLARDSLAARRAGAQLGLATTLCPDSAFTLVNRADLTAGLPRGGEPVVRLLRTDRESTGADQAPAHKPAGLRDDLPSEDWVIKPKRRARLAVRVMSRATAYTPAAGAQLSQASPRANLRLARGLVRNAARQIMRADVLVTDRLHGVILATVFGVPHVALDNTNGKVHAFHRDWLDDLPGSRRAESLEEARSLADGMLRRVGRPA